MTAHCATCTCEGANVPQPATSHTWAREQAKQATAAAIRAAKDKRTAKEPT